MTILASNERALLLDTFCGAGGCSEGYRRAGFDVVGIDNNPKPLRHYPFPHVCMDALEALRVLIAGQGITFSDGVTWHLSDFAAIHASPPCQGYSVSYHMKNVGRIHAETPRLVADVRQALVSIGAPFVIENVPGAPLVNPIELSGMSFGLKVIRKRIFELHGFDVLFVPSPRIESNYRKAGYIPYSHGTTKERGHLPNIWSRSRLQAAMGIDWMTRDELTQAIPPAYTEYIGKALLRAIAERLVRG